MDNAAIEIQDPVIQGLTFRKKTFGEWAAGAVCQIGSAEWVKLRADELENYGGTIDGLATLWKSVAGHKGRLVPADFARLLAAKDASKARIGAQS